MQRLRQLTCEIYRLTAPHYEAKIGPVMEPLARDLAHCIPLADNATVVDIGTGTGFVLRAAAGPNRRAIGIDLSYQMLNATLNLPATKNYPGIQLIQADAHETGFLRANSIDAVFSSFGLGESDPDRSLRSIHRILKPGGQLALQEWGPYASDNDPRAVVDTTLAQFASDSTDPLRANLRALMDMPLPWQMHLQDAEDYSNALQDAGFRLVMAREYQPLKIMLPVATFLAYALAWAPRALEVAALSPTAQQNFLTAVQQRLQTYAGTDGNLLFAPVIFRATATC